MTGLKRKAIGVSLCIALLFGVLPVYAAEAGQYVTREQAVASLLETVGLGALNETASDISVFGDADKVTPQYADAIGIAVTNGILRGTAEKTLRAAEKITRLEFAVIINRTIRELPAVRPNAVFADVPADSRGEVSRLIRAGIMQGYGNGKFGSGDFLTQSQLAAILSRIEHLAATRPQDDFFYAANRDWLAATKLPAGYPMFSSFDAVTLSNNDKLKAIVDALVKNAGTWQDGTREQKIADFFRTIVDRENRDKEGIEPIEPYLQRLDEVKTAQELLDVSARIENETGMNLLFTFMPEADLMNSNRYSLYGTGLTTTLPTVYMINENPQIKALYENFIAQMFVLTGSGEDEAREKARAVYDLEKSAAQSTLSNEAASKIENIYNPLPVDELAKLFAAADVKAYLSSLGYGGIEKIVVTDPGLMRKTGELLADENIAALKAFARYRLAVNTAAFLSADLETAIDEFNNVFLGISSSMSEEDKAFNLLNAAMSSYLGQIFVEQCFSEAAKADVQDIVEEIIAAYEKRIQNLDWMTDATKAAAIAKLEAINLKIGYPDTWGDPLKNISIKTYAEEGSLPENIFAINTAYTQQAKALLSQPVNKAKWTLPAHTVNARYAATSNEIVFPAGILQAPFYAVEASREQNLGGIGTIIAHEITHAFDNNGAKFDQYGNMNNWWNEEDYAVFQQKCRKVIDLYDGLEIAPDAMVNGNLTVAENVADIGAMACILDIAGGMEEANYQALFASNAKIWRLTATNQMYQLLATQDVHAPNKFRVNQVIKNFPEFYDSYAVKEGDAMYLAPEDRVTVW